MVTRGRLGCPWATRCVKLLSPVLLYMYSTALSNSTSTPSAHALPSAVRRIACVMCTVLTVVAVKDVVDSGSQKVQQKHMTG